MPDNIDPSVFFRNPGAVSEPTSAEPDDVADETSTEGENETETETEAEAEIEVETEPAESGEDEPEEKSDDKPDEKPLEVPDDYEVECTLDGEKTKATIADLKDSYERHKVSTQRFQAAAEIKKEAEQIKQKAEQTVNAAKQRFDTLVTNADAVYDFYMRYAPDVFHAAFEKYATQLQSDNKLYEQDPVAYKALVESRKQQYSAKDQQQKLAAEKAEIERQRKELADAEENKVRERTRLLVDENVPVALQKYGVVLHNAPKKVVEALDKDFRQYMYDNFDPKEGVTKEYILKCAERFSQDKDVIDVIKAYPEKKKAEEKEVKPKLKTVKPTVGKRKERWINPTDFFAELMTAKRNPPGV